MVFFFFYKLQLQASFSSSISSYRYRSVKHETVLKTTRTANHQSSNKMSTNVDHTNPLTLSRFILAAKDLQKNQDLSILFTSIELACKVIASAVRRAGLTGLYGLDGSTNSTGDEVKKLDLLSNDIFINALQFSKKIAVMVSEENEEPIVVHSEEKCGGSKYKWKC